MVETWYYEMSKHTALASSMDHGAWPETQDQPGWHTCGACLQTTVGSWPSVRQVNRLHHDIYMSYNMMKAALSSKTLKQGLVLTLNRSHRPAQKQLRVHKMRIHIVGSHLPPAKTTSVTSYVLSVHNPVSIVLFMLEIHNRFGSQYTFLYHSKPLLFLCFGNAAVVVHPVCCTKSRPVVALRGQDSKSNF